MPVFDAYSSTFFPLFLVFYFLFNLSDVWVVLTMGNVHDCKSL